MLLTRETLSTVVALGPHSNGARWTGTGFFYTVQSTCKPDGDQADFVRVYLVTNRHVVDDLPDKFYFRCNDVDGKATIGSLGKVDEDGLTLIYGHPSQFVDLVVTPISNDIVDLDFNAFTGGETALTISDLETLGVHEGDGVFLLGFPLGNVGELRNLPIVRGGIVARIAELYAHDTEHFLIDAPAFPGNSGGPVLLQPTAYTLPGGRPHLTPRLIGVVAKYLSFQDHAVSTQTDRTRVIFEENVGLAEVYPVNAIHACIQRHIDIFGADNGPGPERLLIPPVTTD